MYDLHKKLIIIVKTKSNDLFIKILINIKIIYNFFAIKTILLLNFYS
jgi:hypothetical protein